MQREKAAGVSFREEIIEVAFEQRTERRFLSRLRRDPYVTGERYRSIILYRMSAERRISLKTGGNTDFIFALNG